MASHVAHEMLVSPDSIAWPCLPNAPQWNLCSYLPPSMFHNAQAIMCGPDFRCSHAAICHKSIAMQGCQVTWRDAKSYNADTTTEINTSTVRGFVGHSVHFNPAEPCNVLRVRPVSFRNEYCMSISNTWPVICEASKCKSYKLNLTLRIKKDLGAHLGP